jgi:MoaA/NifB/PqqE/SkfB family radical SAM enzyme
VGFTTNGTLLTGEVAGMLIDQGLDTLCISIAGATEGTHGSIRKGSSLKQIFSNILVLQEYKRRRRVKKPYVTVSYILSRHNIHELPQAVGLVADLGVGDMVATHIDFVHNKQTDDDKVFSFFVVNPEYEAFLEKARQEARKHKIILRTYPLRLEEAPCCELNPLQFVLVNYRGDICPCTYLSLPAAKRIFCGQSYNVEQVSFGNIHEESFQEIWEKPGYKMFREPFLKRRNLLKKQVGLSLLSGTDPGKAETACLRLKEEMAKNPLPEPCRICYKAYGI